MHYEQLPINRDKGVHHTGVDDAVNQAEHFIKLNKLANGAYLK
jgi:hypothetical protein